MLRFGLNSLDWLKTSLRSHLPRWSVQAPLRLLSSCRILLVINVCLSFVWCTLCFCCLNCPLFFQESRCCADLWCVLISLCRLQPHQNCHFMNPDSHPLGTMVIVPWIQELLELTESNHPSNLDANRTYLSFWIIVLVSKILIYYTNQITQESVGLASSPHRSCTFIVSVQV